VLSIVTSAVLQVVRVVLSFPCSIVEFSPQLWYGLRHHDGWGRDPDGKRWCDGYAQSLQLGQL